MLDQNTIQKYADQLYESLTKCVSTSPLSGQSPDITVDDAYKIQMINVQRALDIGASISGKKIGLTSLAMQEMLGVNEPDYGHLYNTMYMANGRVHTNTLLQPKVEGEIAFVLKEDVTGPNATAEQVLRATDYVVAALEIVDSRVRDWKIKLMDTVADNASSGCYVLGGTHIDITNVSLPDVTMTLYKNGEAVNSGTGADVLGDPALCVAWLANKLHQYGVTLKKGEVVLSGALSAAVAVQAGDEFRASFSTLGDVQASFV